MTNKDILKMMGRLEYLHNSVTEGEWKIVDASDFTGIIQNDTVVLECESITVAEYIYYMHEFLPIILSLCTDMLELIGVEETSEMEL